MHFTLDDVTFSICEDFPLSFNDFKIITDILFDLLEVKK